MMRSPRWDVRCSRLRTFRRRLTAFRRMGCSTCSLSGAYASSLSAQCLLIAGYWMFRRDARLLPHVTRVANPYAIPDTLPTDVPSTSGVVTSAGAILPSEEWRELFLRRFKNFRKVSPLRFVRLHSSFLCRGYPRLCASDGCIRRGRRLLHLEKH